MGEPGHRLCPVSVSYFLSPRWDPHDRTATTALYAQDQWSRGRLSMQGAIRYDRASSYNVEEPFGPSRFVPAAVVLPGATGVDAYNDVSLRGGLAYVLNADGFGSNAVKFAKYRHFVRRAPGFRRGFKLFYHEDVHTMSPARVMHLRPRPDVIVYE